VTPGVGKILRMGTWIGHVTLLGVGIVIIIMKFVILDILIIRMVIIRMVIIRMVIIRMVILLILILRRVTKNIAIGTTIMVVLRKVRLTVMGAVVDIMDAGIAIRSRIVQDLKVVLLIVLIVMHYVWGIIMHYVSFVKTIIVVQNRTGHLETAGHHAVELLVYVPIAIRAIAKVHAVVMNGRTIRLPVIKSQLMMVVTIIIVVYQH